MLIKLFFYYSHYTPLIEYNVNIVHYKQTLKAENILRADELLKFNSETADEIDTIQVINEIAKHYRYITLSQGNNQIFCNKTIDYLHKKENILPIKKKYTYIYICYIRARD